jgi:hypothetical protein
LPQPLKNMRLHKMGLFNFTFHFYFYEKNEKNPLFAKSYIKPPTPV